MNLYTKKLTAGQSFVLLATYKAYMFSFQVSSASGDNGTYSGNVKDPVTGTDSDTNVLSAGQGRVFAGTPDRLLSGITVTCVAGNICIDIGY